ncbi:ubiquitin-domain-containing protein [Rhizophagus irregularis]|uniref:Ubiquitin-domain-containing protein n=1 Tax=Rhizophagus irregularis TaxID=588596 RepID=A0A2I1HDK2_9GLOM|nr:ubiquitin-domain-containing protein [Rhizophagus irregularis]
MKRCYIQNIENLKYVNNDEIKVYNRQKFDRSLLCPYEYGFVQTSSSKVGIKTLTGELIVIDHLDFSETVEQLKLRIYNAGGIPPDQQRLIFDGKQLEDDRRLSDYRIMNDSTFLLSPQFDFDLTNIKDNGLNFTRGGEIYKRPCGWNRIALNVINKYPEGNGWLGVDFQIGEIPQNEWAVSYHGTDYKNAKSIAADGYLLSKGLLFNFGKGIYSTLDIDVAASYSRSFELNGERYIFVFQNRVNPKTLRKISKDITEVGEYWISPNECDIRPYGICIKRA